MKKEKKTLSKKSVVKLNFKMLAFVIKTVPEYMLGVILQGVFAGIHSSVGIIYSKTLLDALGRGDSYDSTVKIALWFALYSVIYFLLANWYWVLFNPVRQEHLRVAIHKKLFDKATKIDLAEYDNPAFYNDFVFAMDQSAQHVVNMVEDTGRLINRIIASLTITGVLFSVDITIALLIMALSAARIAIIFKSNRLRIEYTEKSNPISRKEGYINRIFRFPDFAKDLRISRVKENLFNLYNGAIDDGKALWREYGRKFGVNMFFMNTIGALGIGLPIIIILYKVMVTKTVGVGGFAVSVNAIWSMSWLFSDLIERVMRYHEHGIFIEKIFRFSERENKVASGSLEAGSLETLELKNVSFSYTEDKSAPVLKNVNMTLKRGEKIAVVGYNGAGKTTLIKLLLKLYDPDEGEILYNGRSLKEYSKESYRPHTAAVFQDFKLFVATIAENVVGGEYDPSMEKNVMSALEKSMFTDKLKSLKDGLNTVLTREFDENGTLLSGGEQQKVAIARAFYKNAELIILDEPSSALDPDAEYRLNRSIAEYAEDKTVIFISHRLSTTRSADRIYMFDSGELVEIGTHDELIAAGGKYAYMFNLQAEKYKLAHND